MRLRTADADGTEAVGARLADRLHAGDVVLVSGELGAGKTTLIRGACRALGVREPVTSPTFTVGQLYAGRTGDRSLEVAHLDLYRLSEIAGEDVAILDDYLGPQRIAFVEWPDVARDQLERVVATVRIDHAGGDRREIEIT